jgi:uncharacterized membrane protein
VLKNLFDAAICRVLPFFCTLPYSSWISWNLFLAFIPMALSFWLFRRSTRPNPFWWLVFLIYAAFLPNAPYLLTDIIHTIQAVRSTYSIWVITLIFLPIHFVAIFSGFQAYVIALINQGTYLTRRGHGRWVNVLELMTHALSALGIYMGRFDRLNSWEFVSDPTEVLQSVLNNLTAKFPVVVIVVSFFIITVLYWVMKQVNLGLVLRYREVRQQPKPTALSMGRNES